MVKEPRPGRVKTRLGRDIGMIEAAWWYRHQTRALFRHLKDPRWDILLAVAPDHEGRLSRIWPAYLSRIPQGRGDLGERMARAMAVTAGPTVLIGSDIPAVRRHHIARAFALLHPSGSVIGPATDGGFWLIGLGYPGRRNPQFFKGVRWSTRHTLQDTLHGLPRPVARADVLDDIDQASDLTSSW